MGSKMERIYTSAEGGPEWVDNDPLLHRKITTICAGERSVRRSPWMEQLPLMKRVRKVLSGKSDSGRSGTLRK